MKKIIIILLSLFILFSCTGKNNIEILSIEGFSPLKKIEEKISHIKTPNKVEALYYSASGVVDEKKINNFLEIAKNTSINSIIIDIKEVDGYTSFTLNNEKFGKIKPISNNKIKKISEVIKTLHSNNIYIIARIVVFKDNLLTKNRPDLSYKWTWDKNKTWYDYAGNKYLDANNKEVWDYNLEIAKQVYELGFDEINLDYIRFPSDGKTSQIYAPFSNEILEKNKFNGKIKIINNFSKYFSQNLKKTFPEVVISADVFGLLTNGDLLSIGQSLEGFLENFDFVAPMTYPSHYGKGFLGFKNPDNHPYEIISDSLKNSYNKIEKYNKSNLLTEGFYPQGAPRSPLKESQIRLWLQGFSCTRCSGSTPYMDNKFKKQTKAITDNEASGFAVWNANSNYYESWYK